MPMPVPQFLEGSGVQRQGMERYGVPGMWELNGFGDPIYVNTGYAWRNQVQEQSTTGASGE